AGKPLEPGEAQGMTPEEIVGYFYDQVVFTRGKKGWKTEFNAERMRGAKLTSDLLDAKTGKILVEAGTKLTPRLAKTIKEDGVTKVQATRDDMKGRYVAVDIINENTGEIYVEAGDELTSQNLKLLDEAGVNSIPTLHIDHI